MPQREKQSPLERFLFHLEILKSKIPQKKHGEFFNHLKASADIVARDYIEVPRDEMVGEAYLAFRSDELPEIVLKGLYEVKDRINAPEGFDIILYDNKSQLPMDSNLPECWESIARWGKDYLNYPYMLRARLKGATNLQVNKIVGNILGVLLEAYDHKSPFPIYDGNQYTDQQYMKYKGRYIYSDEPALSEIGIKTEK